MLGPQLPKHTERVHVLRVSSDEWWWSRYGERAVPVFVRLTLALLAGSVCA